MYLNEAGDFLARITSKGIITTDKSSAVAIGCEFEVHYRWRGKEWEKCEPMICSGRFWVIDKTGEILREAVERFVAATGWSGDLATIKTEDMNDCRITCGAEVYNGKTYYRAQWVNPYDTEPSGTMVDNTDEDVVAMLKKKYGSVLTTISKHTDKPNPAEDPAPAGNPADDDIPF